jgi:fibro-slime domain-containing protein
MLPMVVRLPRLGSLALVLAALTSCAGVRPANQISADAGGAGEDATTTILTGTGGRGSAGASGEGVGGTTVTCDGGGGCRPVRIPEGCGDGINNQGGIETCDDGNTLAGDGCNGACQVEPNWECPPAGPCHRTFACGDGVINPGEVCDDGNITDNDGCNATCTVQDPAYTCTPGAPCKPIAACVNRRVEPGETCDDGNMQPNDGCSAACARESGWLCPAPGMPCVRAPSCGDGVVNVTTGEVCDDGNTADGDGCSADCTIKAAGCTCVPGRLCTCPEVRCGDGVIEGNERCDDGNAVAGDGCSALCQVETGYRCPFPRSPCLPVCGDGIVVAGKEQCDPGVAIPNMNLACSTTCRWNPGWACTGSPPTACHRTVCGDGVKEGLEGCDDGNNLPYDGCSSDCKNEPSCAGAACTARCGDGVLLGEACEDGNNVDGDGCSSTCQVEPGFTCTRPPLGDRVQVPIVYRDFLRAHADFEPGATGFTAATTGLVAAQLDAAGKPVFAAGPGTGFITSVATFAQWYRDVPGTNHTTASTLTLWNNGTGAYVNRFGPNGEQWALTITAFYCGTIGQEQLDANGVPIPCTFRFPPTDCDRNLAMGFTMLRCFAVPPNWEATFQTGVLDGNPLFFPVDGDPFTPVGERSPATVPPPYAGNFTAEAGQPPHNFHFTSEVRYWFPFDATKTYVLSFLGDDDVWMFINRRLAVDLGGIHSPAQGAITLTGANAAAFGMTNGNVYEVQVFQAERQTTSSSYKLTLSGFNGALSQCAPTCGDGVITAGEQCDNGTLNLGGYNQCTPDCRLGPFCGDGKLDVPNEQCDNGANDDLYGSASGCSPGCRLPARCGDRLVQIEFGESCDDGINDGRYGGCTVQCQRAGYCGDGITQTPNETCDDGVNDGSYGTCGDPTQPLPNCSPAPRCGDGIVQDARGEECEPMASGDPNCTPGCKHPGVCGDAIVRDPEQCDYGVAGNTGAYGGCAPGCIRAPYCGDGVKNGPEDCDDGILDNSYGGCSPQCKRAPHCGDGTVDAGFEDCDQGAANGPTSTCTTTCKAIIP